jgi:NIMA (never in mitosis gene a)-related kinase
VETRKIYHRDIKPENILITTGLDVKVTDFGVSKTLYEQKIQESMRNTLVGTPVYLSPILWKSYVERKEKSD